MLPGTFTSFIMCVCLRPESCAWLAVLSHPSLRPPTSFRQVYCTEPYSAHSECDSGHAYSEDGFNWFFGEDEPFGGRVNFTDGTSTAYSTRERPHLVFADKERHVPMGVFTAVSDQPIGPSCDTCHMNTCSQCKITPGRDWTFTQFEPFVNFNATAEWS